MANADKGNIEVINGSIAATIARLTEQISELQIQLESKSTEWFALNNLPSDAEDMEKLINQILDLRSANESMQEDAVQNTYAFNLMLTANKKQAAEIARLTEKVRYAYTQIEALERAK